MTQDTTLKVSDIPPGQMRVIVVEGVRVAVCNVGGAFYAIEDVCTHDEGPLGEGKVVDGQVECPRHGGRFDVKTGQATRMPAVAPARTFPVRVEGGVLVVEVETHAS